MAISFARTKARFRPKRSRRTPRGCHPNTLPSSHRPARAAESNRLGEKVKCRRAVVGHNIDNRFGIPLPLIRTWLPAEPRGQILAQWECLLSGIRRSSGGTSPLELALG